jgi:hypothetical protein
MAIVDPEARKKARWRPSPLIAASTWPRGARLSDAIRDAGLHAVTLRFAMR